MAKFHSFYGWLVFHCIFYFTIELKEQINTVNSHFLLMATESYKISALNKLILNSWISNLKKKNFFSDSIFVLQNRKWASEVFSDMAQFSSAAQSCPTLCAPMDCSTPGLPVHHQLPEFTQTHVHRISDAIQSSHPLSSPSPPDFNLSQHQGLFQWVSSLHQVAKVLEFQQQSFQWIFRTDFL